MVLCRLHMAGNSIGIIRAFYSLGVRYVSWIEDCCFYGSCADGTLVYPHACVQQCICRFFHVKNRSSPWWSISVG